MRIALKYGLLITLGVIAWVVVMHLLVRDPRSPVHGLGAFVFFNVVEIAGIYFGIKARRDESEDGVLFKTGIKTGVAISVIYIISTSLFFLIAIGIFGAKLMAGEPGSGQQTPLRVALQAFAGLALGVIFGLIYSTLISFFLARRLKS